MTCYYIIYFWLHSPNVTPHFFNNIIIPPTQTKSSQWFPKIYQVTWEIPLWVEQASASSLKLVEIVTSIICLSARQNLQSDNSLLLWLFACCYVYDHFFHWAIMSNNLHNMVVAFISIHVFEFKLYTPTWIQVEHRLE